MAEEKDKKVESDKPAAQPDKSVSPETTTANDGSIAINQPAATATATITPEAPTAPQPDKSVPETLMQQPTASETPQIVLSEDDVSAAQKENDPHEALSEQIEVLTGEVQALESKIENLTSGVTNNASEPAAEPKVSTPELTPPPAMPVEDKKPELPEPPKQEEKPTVPSPVEPVKESIVSTPVAAANAQSKPVNDIYTKILNGPQEQTPPADHKDLNDEATLEEGSSGIGTIGEVLVVFGMIALLILLASPFFKSALGDTWEPVRAIGWPTAAISLALGFIFFLFNKGRLVFKLFSFVLLLVAAVMFMSVFDYTSYLGPLADFLTPIATFYK